MSGSRVGAFVVALALVAASPARAQEPAPETTEVPAPTTAPPTTAAPVAPEATVPEVTVPDGSSTTIPGETTTTTAPPPPDDPAAHGDAPPETVPDVDLTVPPRAPEAAALVGSSTGRYAGQRSFASYPGRVVRVTSRGARARAQETQAALDAAVAVRDLLVARQGELRAEIGRLAVAERQAIEALEEATVELERRAADAYIRGNLGGTVALLTAVDANQLSSRLEMLEAVLEADQRAIEAYRAARAEVDESQAAAAAELASVSNQALTAEQGVLDAQAEVEFASRELAVTLAGGSVVIHGFTFPVGPPFQYGDSFGAARMTGTEYEHWHEGTDIFAPMGTELLAAERGVITRMGTNTLGGITLWLLGESGTAYYYAHLVGFAPGVREGLVVEPGTVVGYVGDTGNARGTPPHLHFEIHPNRGPAVNPYPILVVAQEQPQPEPIRL